MCSHSGIEYVHLSQMNGRYTPCLSWRRQIPLGHRWHEASN
nr:MAG TPA: hypothetical protein [Caudoviricetes sp.]